MRTRLYLCFIIMLLIVPARVIIAQNETFLRKFEFELSKIGKNAEDNQFYLTLEFYKGNKYKFNIENYVNGKGGAAIVEIHDGEKLVGTNASGEKYFSSFLFQCSKTSFYQVIIKFKNQSAGSSVIDMSIVN
jgi:hypothetical protein